MQNSARQGAYFAFWSYISSSSLYHLTLRLATVRQGLEWRDCSEIIMNQRLSQLGRTRKMMNDIFFDVLAPTVFWCGGNNHSFIQLLPALVPRAGEPGLCPSKSQCIWNRDRVYVPSMYRYVLSTYYAIILYQLVPPCPSTYF
jgi:hypothetical protein